MCYLNYKSRHGEEPTGLALPDPRLAWVVPVEATALAASLEAYANMDPAITTLRLAHRFGRGSLSKIPVEILEMIVDQAQQSERLQTSPFWRKTFACFRGICTDAQHYDKNEWHGVITDYDHIDSEVLLYLHEDLTMHWLNYTCFCEHEEYLPFPNKSFKILNELLRNRFGLEMCIFHEVLSEDLDMFMPRLNTRNDFSYYTSAFLTLASGSYPSHQVGKSKLRGHHHVNGPQKNYLSFRERIDPIKLVISADQQQRFSKAMRVLGLSAHYHVSELESVISQPHDKQENGKGSDKEQLWNICGLQLPGGPKPDIIFPDQKQRMLRQFLSKKSSELAKESWPQLQLLSASDAVTPY